MLWSVLVLLLIALAGAVVLGVVLAFVGTAVVEIFRGPARRGRTG